MLTAVETEEQYDNALAQIYDLMQTNLEVGSHDSDELERLSILVEVYEKINYPFFKTRTHP